MRIKFWGVRGSIPTPEHRNDRYGGNTTCVEVRLANGTLIILDCGSGLRGLGKSLLREFGDQRIAAYIFLTHFHWDHIQGIPFFLPLYKKGNAFLFHTIRRTEEELKKAVEGQMASPYFPLEMSMLGSIRNFYDLDYSAINVQGAVIRSAPLNHPQGSVAYRVEADGQAFVFATDTEPGSPEHDEALRVLARGADLFVYDSQYTPEQLRSDRKGWGHSSWREGVTIAQDCGVKRLVLFHHDPESDDEFVDALVQQARQHFANVGGAAEGMEIDLRAHQALRSHGAFVSRGERRYYVELPVRLLWRRMDGETSVAEGTTHDVSESGCSFSMPSDVPTNRPLQLEIVVPCAVSGKDELRFRYAVQPLRVEPIERAQDRDRQWLRVAARRLESQSSAWPQKVLQGAA